MWALYSPFLWSKRHPQPGVNEADAFERQAVSFSKINIGAGLQAIITRRAKETVC
jgi:hypothetical protein